jgi:hypothetical protein
VVRCSSEHAAYWHGYARALPSPQEQAAAQAAAVRALDPAAAQALREQQEDRERSRRQDEHLLWRGRRPEGPIADIPEARELVRCDRPLIDALAAAPAAVLREVAHCAARWALTEAGMADIDWIAAALTALEAGRALPAPFDDDAQVWRRLFTDERIPATTVRSPDGGEYDWSRQHFSMPALLSAAHPDPLRAAVASIAHAVVGVGPDGCDALVTTVRNVLAGRG